MDWFYCNICCLKGGKNFAMSSCGHIFCEKCRNASQCRICSSTCTYLAISDQMKPQEKMFFRDPAQLLQSSLDRIRQFSKFQDRQKERVIAFHIQQCKKLERTLKETMDKSFRQLSELKRENEELKRENEELKKPLSQRRASPLAFQINGGTRRMTLPVAVTSPVPVTPRSRSASSLNSSSSDTLERFRHARLVMTTPLGSASSMSSLRTPQENSFRTPSSANTPARSDHSNSFAFQFLRSTLHSPR